MDRSQHWDDVQIKSTSIKIILCIINRTCKYIFVIHVFYVVYNIWVNQLLQFGRNETYQIRKL